MRVILLVSLLLLVSCATVKRIGSPDNQTLTATDSISNIAQITGDYELSSENPDGTTLDMALLFKKYWKHDLENKKRYWMSIKAADRNKIQVEVFKDDKLVASKKIRYQLNNGILIIVKKRTYPFLIIDEVSAMSSRFHLLKSGDLMVNYHSFRLTGFILFPLTVARVHHYGIVFKKLSYRR